MFACSYYSYLIKTYDKNKYESPFEYIFVSEQPKNEIKKYINDLTEFILYEYKESFDNMINDYYNYYSKYYLVENKDLRFYIDYEDETDYYNGYRTFIESSFNSLDELKTKINMFKNKLLSLKYNDEIINNIIMRNLILKLFN